MNTSQTSERGSVADTQLQTLLNEHDVARITADDLRNFRQHNFARDNLKMKLPLVVRLSGTNEEEGRAILKQNGIEPGVNAWQAAQKIVELTRAPVS